MSNFQEKFNNWQERMNRKTEKEKHNYALTVSFLLGAIVLFFVASNWYFRLGGESFDTSIFTDIESILNKQKENFSATGAQFKSDYSQIKDTVTGSQTVYKDSSTTNSTGTVAR